MAITQNTYTGNGSTTTFSFTFPYLKTTDVKVTLNGGSPLATTEYSQSATSITFNTAPAVSDAIRIYRETADTDLTATFYPGSAIRSSDLNDNFTQNLYTTQEVVSRYIDKVGTIPLAGNLNAGDYKITNLGTPTAQTDAATKEYVDDQDNLIAGTDLTKVKDDSANTITINHDAVGAASVNNSDGTVIQDLTISASGHVTGHNSVNLDGRYYTESELNSGQLDGRYYTESELNSGQLDNRYYTESELAGGVLDSRYYTESESDSKYLSTTYSSSINTVYSNIGAVEAVGKDLANSFTNIDDYGSITGSVSSSSGTSNIQIVASDISNVSAVGPSIANVNTIATTSGLIADIATVAADGTDIGVVAGKATEIGLLGTSTNVSNMNTLVNTTNLITGTKNLDAVAGNATNINTVGAISSNVSTVAGIAANVTTVAGDTTAINNITTNLTAVQNAATNATTATTQATAATTAKTAAEAAQTAAEQAETDSLQTLSDVRGVYEQQRSGPYNISSASDFGNLASALGIFASETGDTLLTMSIGTSTFDYLGV